MPQPQASKRGQLVWYFAYGSNLNTRHLRERIGDWVACRKATLRGWQRVFNVDTRRWGGKSANVRPATGRDEVQGAVYLVTTAQLDILTSIEGVPPQLVTVETENGPESAYTYAFDPHKKPGRVPDHYWAIVEEGLREHGYSEDVIDHVKRAAGR